MACAPMRGGPRGSRYDHHYMNNGLGGYSCIHCGQSEPDAHRRKRLGLTKKRQKKYSAQEVSELVRRHSVTARGKTVVDLDSLELEMMEDSLNS